MTAVSEYLHTGWHEFFLPVTSRHGEAHLRVWIDMAEVLPMLRRLDRLFGDEAHPYALRIQEIPAAQRELIRMVMDLVLEHPEAVRRVAASRRLAADLADRFGIGPSAYPIRYPQVIDQVDLDSAHIGLALPFILRRDSGAAPEPET